MNTPTGNTFCRCALLAAGLILSASGAAADDEWPWAVTTTISETVDVRDIDITTPEGARTAYERIVAAATRICVTPVQLRVLKSPTQQHDERQCLDRAIAEAVARTDAAAGIDLLATAGEALTEESDRLASVR